MYKNWGYIKKILYNLGLKNRNLVPGSVQLNQIRNSALICLLPLLTLLFLSLSALFPACFVHLSWYSTLVPSFILAFLSVSIYLPTPPSTFCQAPCTHFLLIDILLLETPGAGNVERIHIQSTRSVFCSFSSGLYSAEIR
jgi:hypothetical protein